MQIQVKMIVTLTVAGCWFQEQESEATVGSDTQKLLTSFSFSSQLTGAETYVVFMLL